MDKKEKLLNRANKFLASRSTFKYQTDKDKILEEALDLIADLHDCIEYVESNEDLGQRSDPRHEGE